MDDDGRTFLHWTTVSLSGSDMRQLLTELPSNIVTSLLKAKDKKNRTPLCLAAAWNEASVDVIVEVAAYFLQHASNPGINILICPYYVSCTNLYIHYIIVQTAAILS